MNNKNVIDGSGVTKTGFEGMYSHLDSQVGSALKQNPNAASGALARVLKNTPALVYLTKFNGPKQDYPVAPGEQFTTPVQDKDGNDSVSEPFNFQ